MPKITQPGRGGEQDESRKSGVCVPTLTMLPPNSENDSGRGTTAQGFWTDHFSRSRKPRSGGQRPGAGNGARPPRLRTQVGLAGVRRHSQKGLSPQPPTRVGRCPVSQVPHQASARLPGPKTPHVLVPDTSAPQTHFPANCLQV